MTDAARFGARLKELREASGLTQQELAKKVGVSARSVTFYEAGRMPTWDVVVALADAIGVDCTAFTQQPAEREPAGPGRPPKAKEEAEPNKTGKPKRKSRE